ncbi:unnamed protein product [Boreogadus saida]
MGSNHDLKEDQCQTPELVPGNIGLKSAPVGFKQPRHGISERYGNIRTSLMSSPGDRVFLCVCLHMCVCMTAANHTTMRNGGPAGGCKTTGHWLPRFQHFRAYVRDSGCPVLPFHKATAGMVQR